MPFVVPIDAKLLIHTLCRKRSHNAVTEVNAADGVWVRTTAGGDLGPSRPDRLAPQAVV